MGAAPSKPPPIIKEDPSPNQAPVNGIGVGGKTQSCQVCQDQRRKRGCSACKFYIGQGVSAASAKLYRESGNVTQQQCNALSLDLERVDKKELAFDQVRARLIDGKYFQNLNNGYCGRIMVKAGEETNITNKESLNGRLIQPEILKMTVGGGYSSLTKLFIKPSVPFRITLNGITETVETMTLFHPAPIRIENVQHDAVLTLNDTADTTKKLIALIPLKGSLAPGEGGRFFSKIASYIPGILRPNPVTNQYDPIDVPTGNDWDLSRIFPGKPDATAKQTATTDGFFTWRAVTPVERYLKKKHVYGDNIPIADIYEYGWRPIQGAESPMYVMLQNPIEINSFDLQTIRMLPVTPTEDAMPPPLVETVTYTPQTECKSNALLTGKKEKFENKSSKCDPFAAMQPVSRITSDDIFAVVMGILTAVAVFIGLYFALKYASDNNWGTKIQSWGRQLGKYLASAPPPGSDAAPAPAPAPAPSAPSGGPRRTTPRQGEDFAYSNDAAIELRRRKKAEEAELARLKREADAAAAKAKADEAAELERLRKEADENAREARDQEAARAELERKQEEEAKARLARPATTGPSKSVATRPGEDFAFTSPLADRQRQKRAEAAEMARLKKEADEAAAKAKAEEAAELARLKRQAETERLRGEAAGTGLFGRDELAANTERARKEAEQLELDRLRAEAELDKREAEREARAAARRARRNAMSPLERAQDDLKDANATRTDLASAVKDADSNLLTAREYLANAKKMGNPAIIATSEKNLKEAEKHLEDARAALAKTEADREALLKRIKELEQAPPAKQLKQRIIRSSDRELTAEEKEQKKKDEEMVARLFRPKKEYEDRKPAADASVSARSAASPPAEDAKKKADINAKLQALQKSLVEIRERNKTARFAMRKIVDARNKAKTLRTAPPKVPGQTQREIDELDEELEKIFKQSQENAQKAESDAKRQQAQASTLLAMGKKFATPEIEKRIADTNSAIKELETDAAKTKEAAEAEREKAARDLAAAQSRLRQSQAVYNRATQRRNLTTGRGRTQRRR